MFPELIFILKQIGEALLTNFESNLWNKIFLAGTANESKNKNF